MNLVPALHRRDNIESRKFYSELINVLKMPGRNQQKNRELKRVAQSCSKLTDIFKKSRPEIPLMKVSMMSQAKKYARRVR